MLRLGRLHASTAALTAARTVLQIADAALELGVDALGAETGVFVRAVDDATLAIVASMGVPASVPPRSRPFHVTR